MLLAHEEVPEGTDKILENSSEPLEVLKVLGNFGSLAADNRPVVEGFSHEVRNEILSGSR